MFWGVRQELGLPWGEMREGAGNVDRVNGGAFFWQDFVRFYYGWATAAGRVGSVLMTAWVH